MLLKQELAGSKEHAALLDLHAQLERELQAQLEQESLSQGSLVVKEGLQRLKGDIVTESDPSLAAAMPDDENSPADVEDDDGLDHPSDNAPLKAPKTSTVAYCAVCPNTRGPVTRRVRCRGGSERVQRDRVEQLGLGHERVTIQSEAPARGSHVQLWRSTVKLAKEPFEISAG